jgi:hypothetical protein
MYSNLGLSTLGVRPLKLHVARYTPCGDKLATSLSEHPCGSRRPAPCWARAHSTSEIRSCGTSARKNRPSGISLPPRDFLSLLVLSDWRRARGGAMRESSGALGLLRTCDASLRRKRETRGITPTYTTARFTARTRCHRVSSKTSSRHPGGAFYEKTSRVKPDVAGGASASDRFARLPFDSHS